VQGFPAVGAVLSMVLCACGGSGGGQFPEPDAGVPGGGYPGGGIVERTLSVEGQPRLVNPRFSPDGTRIAFVQLESEADSLAVMNANGTGHQVLGTMASYLTGFAWTADGSELYFSGTGVFRIPAEGGSLVEVLDWREGFASYSPDLSPDGTRLVFGVNGSTLRLVDLTQSPPAVQTLPMSGNSPRFSPDGQTIAYADKSASMIRLMDADGTHVRDVVPSDGFFASVDWFSDGQRLVATTDVGLEIVTLQTGQRRQLRRAGAVMDIDLSADDSKLVFSINGQLPLYVMSGF
jgi:Tol biopolymer transport system component